MSLTCSCIIPVYNEESRIADVLEAFLKVQEINEIICVDDCSTDKTYELIKKNYPKIKLLRLLANQGKSSAIYKGLNQAKGRFIFLADADIISIKPEEIRKAITAIQSNSSIDMIILRRNKTALSVKLSRADVVFSGERILRKKDLIEIFKLKPRLYQIEAAINEYMIRNKKKVYWVSASSKNVFKTEKLGLVKGTWGEFVMHRSLIKYLGLTNYITQRLFFAHKKLPNGI